MIKQQVLCQFKVKFCVYNRYSARCYNLFTCSAVWDKNILAHLTLILPAAMRGGDSNFCTKRICPRLTLGAEPASELVNTEIVNLPGVVLVEILCRFPCYKFVSECKCVFKRALSYLVFILLASFYVSRMIISRHQLFVLW